VLMNPPRDSIRACGWKSASYAEVARLGKTILFPAILAVSELATRGHIEDGKLVALGTLQQFSEHVMPHRHPHIGLLDRGRSAPCCNPCYVSEVRFENNASLEWTYPMTNPSINFAKLLAQDSCRTFGESKTLKKCYAY
jgi:hypothetical protein